MIQRLPFFRQTLLVALALASTLAALPIAAAPDPSELRKTSASLLRTVPLPMKLQRPPPAKVDPKLRARAQQLRQELQRTMQDGLPSQLGNTALRQWSAAVMDSFRASMILEYSSFADAETYLKSWWTSLAATPTPGDPVVRLRLSLELADHTIRTWLAAEPQACARLIEEIERTFQPLQRPELRALWEWNLSSYQEALRYQARRLPAAERQALEAGLYKSAQAHLRDETIPLPRRTRSVARLANELYARMEIPNAVALLDHWSERYPTALEDFHWLFERYYVAAIGEGDFRKASLYFRRLEALAVREGVDTESDRFKAITQSYYRYLSQPQLSNAARAAEVRQQRLKHLSIPITP